MGIISKKFLEAHKRWLDVSEGWSEEDRADLSGADLGGIYMRKANLRKAFLNGANLTEAYLMDADLSGAKLRRADLSGACFWGANLKEADLREADLSGACLTGADLEKVDLSGACLSGACLSGAKNIPFIPLACPDTGSFVAWKTCRSKNGMVIVKLLIPEDAMRSSGTSRKCRADKAVVLEIQTINGDALEGVIAWSIKDNGFIYEVGKTVTPKEPFCEDRFKECASGIHFFINRQEAVEY